MTNEHSWVLMILFHLIAFQMFRGGLDDPSELTDLKNLMDELGHKLVEVAGLHGAASSTVHDVTTKVVVAAIVAHFSVGSSEK